MPHVDDWFWKKVERVGACWEWTGGTNGKGYGQARYMGRKQVVHRIAWKLIRGPIPDDMVLDHLCRNRLCVNPDHLEPVTTQENILRGMGNDNSRKTVCQRGHELTPRRDGRGRECNTCKREYRKARYQRDKNRQRR